MRLGVALGARCCFYNYANIERTYPPPFSLFERYSFRHAAHAMACNQEAATIIRRHGYTGPLTIVPQFGVDTDIFSPKRDEQRKTEGAPVASPFVVGYVGRLVPEKGILDLVEAVGGLPPHVRLRLVGDGSQRPAIERRIAQLGLGSRVTIAPAVGSTEVPAAIRALDALALPSRTTPSWKEQFGRILIEAMSCGVPVVGSSSGEIPHVIGAAGLVFPEGDVAALRTTLAHLADNPALRADLAYRGRERALASYTQAAIARRHVEVYAAMLAPAT
ncbi:MAG: glycosyltransferase family 4 protein, partial [Chloroflexales bacterium]|nr:glycosyltransferase family 4 protein [Chloroflexales bacterium]